MTLIRSCSCRVRLPCCFYEVDKATQERFAQAFLSLKEGQNEEVLQVLRGKSFVRANNEEYAIVRLVAQQLKMM
jgi:ABC-type phosphate/phosphonate transport system substrate-binding protein